MLTLARTSNMRILYKKMMLLQPFLARHSLISKRKRRYMIVMRKATQRTMTTSELTP